MMPLWSKLLQALGEPTTMSTFAPDTWDVVLRQAAPSGLLGRLGAMAEETGVDAAIPPNVWRHMVAVRGIAEQQRRAVCWELVHLSRSLAELPGPVLLLKGAAYAAAGLRPAAGRLFSDIDLMVPKAQIDAAEAALMLAGWVSNHRSAYDERYYRKWMHELPPMMHIKRQTALDLHHNILPECARIKVRVAPILESASVLTEFPRFSIPAPVDQILHSATHLFHEGEWAHGLRDLSDLDLLLREHGQDEDFWSALLERAARLGLGRPLFYGMSLCVELLATPIPASTLRRCPGQPGPLRGRFMQRLFIHALTTAHKPSRSALAVPAAFALYLRSHYLRMPPHLLLTHLLIKGWQRWRERRDGHDEAETPARGAK